MSLSKARFRDDDPAGDYIPGSIESAVAAPDAERNPAPEYPRNARRNGWQGTVLLLVDVSAEGRATAALIARSSGYRVLDDAAREAVLGWRFRPARRAGVTVSSRVEVPITFRIQR